MSPVLHFVSSFLLLFALFNIYFLLHYPFPFTQKKSKIFVNDVRDLYPLCLGTSHMFSKKQYFEGVINEDLSLSNGRGSDNVRIPFSVLCSKKHYQTIQHDMKNLKRSLEQQRYSLGESQIYSNFLKLIHSKADHHQAIFIQIIDNQLYVQLAALRHPHATRCLNYLIPMLLFLLKHNRFQNMEFIINLYAGDTDADTDMLGVFSYCKRKKRSKHMWFPRMYYNEYKKWESGSKDRMDTYSAMHPWDSKIDKALFRGANTHRERIKLAIRNMTETGQNYMDSAISNWIEEYNQECFNEFNFTKSMSIERMDLKDHLAYKYIISVDGRACADRIPNIMVSNSLLLKQESEYEEYWYRQLIPFVHFIPLKKDLSDLKQKVAWLRKNDKKARKMVMRANRIIQKLFSKPNIMCYANKYVH